MADVRFPSQQYGIRKNAADLVDRHLNELLAIRSREDQDRIFSANNTGTGFHIAPDLSNITALTRLKERISRGLITACDVNVLQLLLRKRTSNARNAMPDLDSWLVKTASVEARKNTGKIPGWANGLYEKWPENRWPIVDLSFVPYQPVSKPDLAASTTALELVHDIFDLSLNNFERSFKNVLGHPKTTEVHIKLHTALTIAGALGLVRFLLDTRILDKNALRDNDEVIGDLNIYQMAAKGENAGVIALDQDAFEFQDAGEGISLELGGYGLGYVDYAGDAFIDDIFSLLGIGFAASNRFDALMGNTIRSGLYFFCGEDREERGSITALEYQLWSAMAHPTNSAPLSVLRNIQEQAMPIGTYRKKLWYNILQSGSDPAKVLREAIERVTGKVGPEGGPGGSSLQGSGGVLPPVSSGPGGVGGMASVSLLPCPTFFTPRLATVFR